ncbi:TraR/DksA C4-type zinc finger protein [Planococcus sp. N028]|uniref:TraR/DksA C4-type zinc finger protein n=1 Tax=Planococcus shixiaomingii TaxID=3058393 RepID=A0ABT8N5C2_9BACL|nr:MULTISPECIES: TraR/DksA C4-type zinc finger protein [unclassified Planococcus (in: firmicutes)]MDN7243091.1 TraR/DksA C4-type zinc finger protein [Planococcus sp. N028]WKA55038.1 TraR/DksA C4-type zinc finger protein [Planococcus sp. N022]
MTDEQLNQLKDQLTDQMNSLERRVQHTEEFDTTELSNYDNHPGDSGTDLFDMERGLALTQFKEEELNDTKAALAAIEAGTYGKCIECGKEIPFERLEAVPTALTCIDHAKQEPDLESRPPEEDVLQGDTGQPVKQEDTRLEDFTDSFQEVEDFGSSDGPQDQPGDDEDMEEFYEEKNND